MPDQTALLHDERSYTEAGVRAFQQKRPVVGIMMLKAALRFDPNYAPAHVMLAAFYVMRANSDRATEHLTCALKNLPPYAPERDACLWLLSQLGQTWTDDSPLTSVIPKLYIRSVDSLNHHRSGWRYATDALAPLHRADGILFEGFLERVFAWEHVNHQRSAENIFAVFEDIGLKNVPKPRGTVPFSEPWVGFIHNPPHMPDWYEPTNKPANFMASEKWQASLPHCRGIFTVSDYLAKWLRTQVDVPVSALIHPTEIPEVQFDWARFKDNANKKVVQIGFWLRQLSAIYQLPTPRGFTKVCLVPKYLPNAVQYFEHLLERDFLENGWEQANLNETDVTNYLPHAEYDRLLSENIVFLKLYETAANNAVIECIARATPLLVNRLPGVIDYLGDDYPLYYSDLDDARQKAEDFGRIQAAHQYLKTCPTRSKLSQDYFLQSFVESEVYQQL